MTATDRADGDGSELDPSDGAEPTGQPHDDASERDTPATPASEADDTRDPDSAEPVEADAAPGDDGAAPEPDGLAAGKKGARLVKRTVVAVAFHIGDAPREFDSIGLILEPGDRVLVETAKEPRPATVVISPRLKQVDARRLRRVVRRITEAQTSLDKVDAQTAEAHQFCVQKIRQFDLPMKLVRVEFSHGGSRATFYFASEDRVDFRELVRELARKLHARIEMRQIGVRDQAKMVGGLGVCGRELCCCGWIHRFAPVSIRMAKDQGLALNPQKVSGVCGRLLCCLTYEQDTYKELRTGLPKVGKKIQTPSGEGRVRDVDVLRGRVRVQLDSGMKEFTREELCGGPCAGKPCAKAPQTGPAEADDASPAPRDSQAPRPSSERPRGPRRPRDAETTAEPPPAAAPEAEGEGPRRSSRRRRRGSRGTGAPEGSSAPAVAQAPSQPPRPAPAPASTDGGGEREAGGEAARRRRRRRRRKPGGGGPGGAPPSNQD